MKDLITIAVIGAGQCTAREARLAEEVGREIARCGAVLICGGLGGVMEAACRGASEAGGLTVGILPGENRAQANPYVQLAIVSGVGRARNLAVAKSARAVIAVGGGYGTLSEIAFALQSNIPVIGLNTWSLVKNGQPDLAIVPAQDAAEAVALAMELAVKS
ncbi:MAG: TIGR00725 family protein [Chloroflexota bacterium]